jgi:hypothetical protein
VTALKSSFQERFARGLRLLENIAYVATVVRRVERRRPEGRGRLLAAPFKAARPKGTPYQSAIIAAAITYTRAASSSRRSVAWRPWQVCRCDSAQRRHARKRRCVPCSDEQDASEKVWLHIELAGSMRRRCTYRGRGRAAASHSSMSICPVVMF